MGLCFFLLAPLAEKIPKPWNFVAYGLAVVLFFGAVWITYKRYSNRPISQGGHAGISEAIDGAHATSGNGGSGAGRGIGGNGGNAKASGRGSVAIGGKGGSA